MDICPVSPAGKWQRQNVSLGLGMQDLYPRPKPPKSEKIQRTEIVFNVYKLERKAVFSSFIFLRRQLDTLAYVYLHEGRKKKSFWNNPSRNP